MQLHKPRGMYVYVYAYVDLCVVHVRGIDLDWEVPVHEHPEMYVYMHVCMHVC